MAEATSQKSGDKDNKYWMNLSELSYLSEERKMVTEALDDPENPCWPKTVFNNRLSLNTLRPGVDRFSRHLDRVPGKSNNPSLSSLTKVEIKEKKTVNPQGALPTESQSVPGTQLTLSTVESPLTVSSIATQDLMAPDFIPMTTRLTTPEWSSIGSLLSPGDSSSDDERKHKDLKSKLEALTLSDHNFRRLMDYTFTIPQESDEDICGSVSTLESKSPKLEKQQIPLYFDESGNLICNDTDNNNRVAPDHKVIPSSPYEDAKSALLNTASNSTSPSPPVLKEVCWKPECDDSPNNSDEEAFDHDGTVNLVNDGPCSEDDSENSDEFKYYTLKGDKGLQHSGDERAASPSSQSSSSSDADMDLPNDEKISEPQQTQKTWKNMFSFGALRSRRKEARSAIEPREAAKAVPKKKKKKNGIVRMFNRVRQRLKRKKSEGSN